MKCIEGQLTRLFIHLMNYSIKESLSGFANLTIQVEQVDLTYLNIRVVSNKENNTAAAYQEQINDILNTAAYNIAGFDLMIGYNIVKNHGGNIQVFRSTKNELAFEVRLPFEQD